MIQVDIRCACAASAAIVEDFAAMQPPARRATEASAHPLAALSAYPADLHEIVLAVRAMKARQKLGSERAMAEALNVKRHQLRRALQALRANGEIAPAEAKRKPLVGHNGENLVRATNPMEVIEMRIAIEPFLARLAALRAAPSEMAAIEAAATTAAGADSGAADLVFHKLIAAGSGNKLAASLYGLLRRVARELTPAAQRVAANLPGTHATTRCRASRHRPRDHCARSRCGRARHAAAPRRRAESRGRAAQSGRHRLFELSVRSS